MAGKDLQGLLNDIYDADNNALRVSSSGTSVSDTAYDATSWNGVTDVAPSKNAVRDKFESLGAGSGALAVIAQTVVGAGGAASIDFTSIAGTYENLRVAFMGRGSSGGVTALLVRLNGDSGGNYDREGVAAQSAAVTSGAAVAQTSYKVADYFPADGGATAGRAGIAIVEIPAYARTVFQKAMFGFLTSNHGTTTNDQVVQHSSGLWRSTAAVTQVTLLPGAGNFLEGSVATLYGLAGS